MFCEQIIIIIIIIIQSFSIRFSYDLNILFLGFFERFLTLATHDRKPSSFDAKKQMLLDCKSVTDGVRTSPDMTRDPEVQNLLRETSKHGFDSVEDLSILTKDELREAGTSLKD